MQGSKHTSAVVKADALQGLGFHKALIWLIIPVEVLYLAWTVVSMLFGLSYSIAGLDPTEIYYEYGFGLHITDIATAVMALLVAAFGVVTEVALVKRRTYGPACAQTFFVVLLFVSIVYSVGLFCVFHDIEIALEPMRYQIFNVALAVLCFNYYKPRLGLFVSDASPSSNHPKLAQIQAAFMRGVVLFGSESEWWEQNRGEFQIVLGVFFAIFILALVLYVVLALNPM